MSKLDKISRYLSKLLRHQPEDLVMDKNGYVEVAILLLKLSISKEDLDWIVVNNDKKRFGYNVDETLIRASQGHSKLINVDIQMIEAPFVVELYHGTAAKNLESILRVGLVPNNRKHVHLSNNLLTARKVALRHSKDIVIFKINSAAMRGDNVKIYISDNGVYLTNTVIPKYISVM
jgi:putative RNA 2'-phosphotransferase